MHADHYSFENCMSFIRILRHHSEVSDACWIMSFFSFRVEIQIDQTYVISYCACLSVM